MIAIAEPEELLTVKQAAVMLHLDERTVRNHINAQRLPARKLPGGKGWLIRRADLLNTLQGSERLGQVPAAARPGIIRRTHTPEGRARALAALDALLEGDTDEQCRAWAHLQRSGPETALEFRRWNPETGDQLGDSK